LNRSGCRQFHRKRANAQRRQGAKAPRRKGAKAREGQALPDAKIIASQRRERFLGGAINFAAMRFKLLPLEPLAFAKPLG
jgi:hypothetical protein